MPEDIEYIRKRGKSLTILSGGIILFVLAGGEFMNEGAFVFGVVEFEHPEYLEYAIIVIFIYFFFRFHLSNRGGWTYFKKKSINLLKGDGSFQNWANQLAQSHIDSLIENKQEIGGEHWHNKAENLRPRGKLIRSNPIKMDGYQPKLMVVADKRGDELQQFTIKCSKTKFYLLLFKRLKFDIRINENFWDNVFPYILGYGAILAIIWESIERLLEFYI